MQYTWNKLLTVIAITAFGMISAPTLSSMNEVFAASLDLSNFGPLKKLGLDRLFDKSTSNNDNQPKSNDNNNNNNNDNQPKSNDNNNNNNNDNQPKSNDNNNNNNNDNQPKSNDNNNNNNNDNQPKSNGNSHAGEKCGANGGNTKDWYCHGTHHHCAKGQNDCELEGGRT